MTVHVGSLDSEVSLLPEPKDPKGPGRPPPEWEERARIATYQARAARDELRTRARGYDD